MLGTFVGFQGTSHIYLFIGDTGRVQYATHAVIDKLGLHWLPTDRSPAACILFGTESQSTLASEHLVALRTEIDDLAPGITPWLPEDQSLLDLGEPHPDEDHGIILQYHGNYNHCKIVGFEPLGAFARKLPNSVTNRALHHLVLAINGIEVQTLQDVQDTLDGYVRSTHGRLHQIDTVQAGFTPSPILGIQLLLVKKPRLRANWVNSSVTFGAGDYSMLRSGFAVLCVMSHPSITQCPPNFLAAMRGPYQGEWMAALFTHLDNCQQIGTYGPPMLPPSNVTVLPAVIVLNM